jgi:hypothetical protein
METVVRTEPLKSSQTAQVQQAQVQQAQVQQAQVQPRDKLAEAGTDMMIHITDKVVALTRKPEFMDRLQAVLDPLINHIINRVFPYILLTSILFLILLLVSVTTFVIVVRGWLSAMRSVDRSLTTGLPDEWFPAAAAT